MIWERPLAPLLGSAKNVDIAVVSTCAIQNHAPCLSLHLYDGRSGALRTLQTLEISKSYNGRRVVDNVSVRVEQGEVVGLLGPNGAGKTTSFYVIVGLISPNPPAVFFSMKKKSRSSPCISGPARASAIFRRKRRFSAS